MTTLVKTGVITPAASTGDQSVTGVGFTPVLELFLTTFQSNTTGTQATARLNIGAATSNSARFVSSAYSRQGSATADTSHVFETNKIVSANTGSGVDTAIDYADFVSQDADGFTINWSNTISTLNRMPWLALGGVSAKVGTFILNGSTGAQAVTGVGFLPKLLILTTSAPDSLTGGQTENYFSFGAGTSSSNRFANAYRDRDGVGTSQCRSRMTSGKIYVAINQSGTVIRDADLTSLDADGFTLNVTTSDGASPIIGYVAIGGIGFNAKVGAMTQPTVAGAQAYTGVGFKPNAMVFAGGGLAALDSSSTRTRTVIGFASGGSQAFAGMRSMNSSPTMFTQRQTETTYCIGTRNGTSGNDDWIGRASYTSDDTDGFTLTWSDVDGVANNWQYIAMSVSQVVTVDKTNLSLTGKNITLGVTGSVTILLDIAADLALASGSDLSLSTSVPVDTGGVTTLALTGEEIGFQNGPIIETASLGLVGEDITLTSPIILRIEPGLLSLTGMDVIDLNCGCYDTSQSYQFGQHTQIVDIITEAYERCGIDGPSTSGTMLDSARRSLEYMFSEWSNNGPNLFAVYQYTITLLPGQASYTLPPNTIYVVNAATRQNLNGNITDLTIAGISRSEYLALPNKQQTSQRPTQFYLERTIIPTLYVWPLLQSGSSCQIITYLMRIQQDITKFCGAIDAPQRAMDAIAAGLASRLALKYAPDRHQVMKAEAKEAYALFLGEDRERVPYRITIDNPWSM